MTGKAELKLEIDYPNEEAGWIDCYLTFGGQRHHLWASDTFPPFPQILEFLLALVTQRLPHNFYWDEEGTGARFEAWPLAPDSPNFHLVVMHDVNESFRIEADLNRQAVVDSLLETLRDFVQHVRPTRGNWHLTMSDIKSFEELQKRGVASRADIIVAQPIHFTLQSGKEWELPAQWMNFEIKGLTPQVVCVLNDTDEFWPNWFGFLEKIMLDQLPAEVKYVNIGWVKDVRKDIASGEITSVESDRDFGSVLRAESLSHPNHFRFIVRDTDLSYVDFLLLDEVQSRRQFVSEFCDVFEDFLETEYQLVRGADGSLFDLRTLPLDRLRALLEKRIE